MRTCPRDGKHCFVYGCVNGCRGARLNIPFVHDVIRTRIAVKLFSLFENDNIRVNDVVAEIKKIA